MNKHYLVITLLLVGSFFVLSGCGENHSEKALDERVTVTDIMGREVTVERPIDRVVLEGSERLVEFSAVYGSGFQDQIVGWGPDLKSYDRHTYDRFVEEYPGLADVPEVGSFHKGTFSVEKVISQRPDVVILRFSQVDLYDGARSEMEKLVKAGIPVVVVDFWKKPVKHTRRSIEIMGELLDRSSRSGEIIEFYNKRLNMVSKRLEARKKPKPEVYLEVGMGGPGEYGNTYGDAGWGTLVERAGGENVARETVPKYGRINPEFLIDQNPDVIVITGRSGFNQPGALRLGYAIQPSEVRQRLRGYAERPGWQQLHAIKQGRIHGIFHGFLFSAFNFTAVEGLARSFYPETFSDVHPEQGLREFHERFLPIPYGGVWTYQLRETVEHASGEKS